MNSCNKKHTIYTGETVGIVLAMYEDDGLTPISVEDKEIRIVIAQGSDVVKLYQNPMPLSEPEAGFDIPYSQISKIEGNKILINFKPEDTKDLDGVYDIQVMQVTATEEGEIDTSVIGVFSNILEIKYAIVGKI